jgi:predicted metal-binding membrane protein
MRAPAAPGGGNEGLAPAYAAVLARVALVAALFIVAALSWVWAARAMRGMDSGPWSDLGGLGWFLGVWVVMMAAMMLPSVAPTIALYSRLSRASSPLSPLLFAAGYLLTWAGAGLVVYGIGGAAHAALGDTLSWNNSGRTIAGVTLMLAAAYELTGLKDVCLGHCRSPLGALLGSWRDGRLGSVRMGVRNGAWCVGCCWALMAALFALGVMSVTWMALVAGLIAFEKLMPWRGVVTYATAGLLLGLGLLLLAAPEALPGLTTPPGMTM